MTEIVVKKNRGMSPEHMAKIRAMRKIQPEMPIVQADVMFECDLPTQQAFMIEESAAVGGTLFKVVLITLQGDKILKRTNLTHDDSKAAALNQLRLFAYKFYFEGSMPIERPEGDQNVSA